MQTDDIFTIMRGVRTVGVNLDTIFSQDETKEITRADVIDAMTSDDNIDRLTSAVFDAADPMRNSGMQYSVVRDKVKQILGRWVKLGKFDKLKNFRGEQIYTASMVSTVQAFNKQFMDAFALQIIPFDDPTKVQSITDPSNMMAQQTSTVAVPTKRIPFYEKALYRRLVDKHIDLEEDETENMFYVMDRNPRISDKERKKRAPTLDPESNIDRNEGMHFRMLPRY
jgi:hypothetical protein